MKKIVSFMMLLCMLFSFSGCSEPAEIDLNSYVVLYYNGSDTQGYIEDYEIDIAGIFNDYAKALKNVKQRNLGKLLEGTISFDNDSDLSNGDKVKILWNMDEDELDKFEDENKVELVFSNFRMEVNGLEERQDSAATAEREEVSTESSNTGETSSSVNIVESIVEAITDKNVTSDGKVLNIYCWNDEFQRRVQDHYPGYHVVDATTGKIGDVIVRWNITPTTDYAYQNNLDIALLSGDDLDADDRVDLFLVEPDYALKYVNSDYTLPIEELGITGSDIENQYKYTQDIVTDYEGVLKGISWQASPGALIYNREIAKEVFGTDDPAAVQEYVKDWDTFVATAGILSDWGYQICSSVGDTYRVYANNVSVPWVVNGKIVIDKNIKKWVTDSRKLVDGGMAGTHNVWGEEWNEGFYSYGDVFCYFGPAWFVNFCMADGVDDAVATNGDWGVTEGPQAFNWGGTLVCAATGTDNGDLIKDIMLKLTTDTGVMEGILVKDDDFVNNKNVMNAYAQSSYYSSRILGGQNPLLVYHANAEKLDLSNISPYDTVCNEEFQYAMQNYLGGYFTYEEALEMFYQDVMDRHPELTK